MAKGGRQRRMQEVIERVSEQVRFLADGRVVSIFERAAMGVGDLVKFFLRGCRVRRVGGACGATLLCV